MAKPKKNFKLNVRKLVESTLRGAGCTIREYAGILAIKTPDGAVWDMTFPVEKKTES